MQSYMTIVFHISAKRTRGEKLGGLLEYGYSLFKTKLSNKCHYLLDAEDCQQLSNKLSNVLWYGQKCTTGGGT